MTHPPPTTGEARVFRPLPENASIEQLIHAYQEQAAAYATVAFALSHRLPNIESKLDALGRELHADRKERKELEHDVAAIAKDLRQLTGRVKSIEDAIALQRTAAALPPMRTETQSSHDLAKHVGQEIADRIDAEARDTSTPPPDKAKMADISEDVLAVAVSRLKADQWDRLEAERKAAETDRRALVQAAEMQRLALASATASARLRVRVAAVLAFLAVAVALVEHFAR